MSDCCEIVDISQESPTEDSYFDAEKGLLSPEKSFFNADHSLLVALSPDDGLFSTENCIFTPEKGIFVPESTTLIQEKEPSQQQKVPRPPNAFMLYANEHRKTMAHLYPADSNKDISKRLGSGWKTLSSLEKHKYFQRAKTIDSEHKKKYPDYVYNPKEARIRKAMREAVKDRIIGGVVQNFPRGGAGARKIQFVPNADQHSLIMPNPLTQLQQNGFFSNYSDLRAASNPENSEDQPEYISQGEMVILASSENQAVNISNNQEITNRGKTPTATHLPNIYLPLSCTKFSASPDLFTNSAQYHKEYIAKYFQSIPDYEVLNVTTEDGSNFPYVTIPKLKFKQNLLEKPQEK